VYSRCRWAKTAERNTLRTNQSKKSKKAQQISVSVWKLPAIHIFAKRPNGRDLGLPIVLFAVATQN